jgi:ABC-type transporter MlaC component
MMFMSRVRIFAALVAASSVVAPTYAQETGAEAAEAQTNRVDGAIAFAKMLTDEATTALTDENATEEAKLANFQEVLADGLALDTIGKFMLGESRRKMTDEQTARFEKIFPDYITKLYAEQFDEIVGKPLEVKDAREIGRADVIVRTEFKRQGDSPLLVDWRVRELKSGERKAIDIIVQGVSIMLVKREEFSSFIATNGIDALLDRLEQEAGV